MVVVACLVGPAAAVDYSWNVGDTGGSWSTTTNWNPAGAPTTADTATLGNVTTGTRTVAYDPTASGALTGLTLTQTTAGGTNLLDVQRGLTVTNAITLGASGGQAQLSLSVPATTAASYSLTPTGGVTINSGGRLSLGVYNGSGTTAYVGNVSGAVTLAGGSLVLTPITGAGSVTSSTNSISGAFTMSSGTVFFDNSGTGRTADRRLQFSSTPTNVTGGAFTANASTNLMFNGLDATFNPTSITTNITPQLNRSGDQTFSTNVVFSPTMSLRGTGVKTVTSTAANNDVGAMIISDESNTAGAATTLKLGGNLRLASGKALPAAGGSVPGGTPTEVQLGIDTNGFTFDLSSNAAVWTPGRPSTLNAVWTLSGSGSIVTNGVAFTATATTVNLGAGLTLESRGGNGVANNLGGGTVAATSTFKYGGAAALATPATLTAAATIGNVEVSAAGALLVNSLGGLQNLAVTNAGGTLVLAAGSTPLAYAGTIANAGNVRVDRTDSPTFSGVVSGAGSLTKLNSGTLTLSGTNTFTGAVNVTGGTLRLGSAAALGGDTPSGTPKVAMAGGTLDLAGFSTSVLGASGSSGTVTDTVGGGTLTIKMNNAALAATLTGGLNLATAVFAGRDYQVLSGSNSFTGTTSIAASTLLAIQSETALGGTSAGSTVAGTLELKGPASTAFSVAEPLAISGGTVRTNAQSGTAGTTTLSAPITLASGTATFEVNPNAPLLRLSAAVGGSGSLSKTQTGTLEIAATSGYTGGTTVAAGTLLVSGSLTGTSGVSVGANSRLAGSGTIAAAISGAGLVSPGSSPGILAAAQLNPSAGLDQAFEFTATGSPDYAAPTASINDVLRLTDPTTPFTTNLASANVIDVYFDVGSLVAGDTFKGGFFTDRAGDFAGALTAATLAYWVKGNGAGTSRTFNGQGYYSLAGFDAALSVNVATVPETAGFSGGAVSGQVTQFSVVPEPGTIALWGTAAGLLGLGVARRRGGMARERAGKRDTRGG